MQQKRKKYPQNLLIICFYYKYQKNFLTIKSAVCFGTDFNLIKLIRTPLQKCVKIHPKLNHFISIEKH